MIGIYYAIFSAVLFGLSTPVAKLLVGQTSPVMLAGLLYLGSGLGLFAWKVFSRQGGKAHHAQLTRGDLLRLGLAVLSGGVVGPVLLMYALATTPAWVVALLLNCEGVMTALLAMLVVKESYDARLVAGMLSICAGGAVVSFVPAGGVVFSAGALLVLAACLAWGIDNNLTRSVSHGDAMTIAASKGLVAGCINCLIALAGGLPCPSFPVVAGALLVGLVGYGVSLVFFVLALRHLGSARTASYFGLAPFVGAVAALIILKEEASAGFALAFALMALGTWLHVTEKHEHEHEHEFVEHEHEHVHDSHHQHEHAACAPPGEPHTHRHTHLPLRHSHPHFPDIHHRHGH